MSEPRRVPPERWLELATFRIAFIPDRKAVRVELEEHLEDKAQDLQRIFPDLSLEEAQARAAAEMGGAEEIGRDLAQIHRPWLGYAWLLSKVLLGFVIGAVLLLFRQVDIPIGMGVYQCPGIRRRKIEPEIRPTAAAS